MSASSYFPHIHSHIEIYLILSGELEVCINNEHKILKEGEISVSFSYDVHSYNAPTDSDVYYLVIPTSFCGDFLPLLSSKRFNSSYIDDSQAYETIKNAIEKILSGVNQISKQGYIYVILGTILDSLEKSKEPREYASAFSSELLIYISNHFKEDLSISSLSAKFGYNQNYLSKSFQNTFGISFVKYLTMLRLREAVLLLQKGEKSVAGCALESGFGSVRSFYRAFEEEFGCSPKEYMDTIENDKIII
jgi:AraC-like DNA-binding protein